MRSVLHQLTVDVVELRDAHRGGLAHVRVGVGEALAKRLAQVLHNLVDADAAHGAHREGADERVRVLRVLDERVDRQDGQIGLRLGVVDEVKVDELR